MDRRCVKDSLRQEVDMDTTMNSDGSSPYRQEFDNFCKEFRQNAVLNGNLTSVMTLEIEENLIKYLLHPQETVAYTETTNWLENFVFCVVSNDDENSCELHIWNDGQKRAVSLENYYSLLTALYREKKCKTLEDFTKKIIEKYVLIPGEVIKYFFNLQTQKKPLLHSQKKGTRHLRCKITSYEYVKKTVYKKRILTEITNTLNGNVVVSNCQEEDATDGDLYSVEKTERICEIINNDVNELSCTSYPSNQFLEVKYAGTKSLALFPENELQNQEHLLTLSSVLYNAGAVPEKTGEVQLEFAIPHKPPKKAVDIDVLATLSDKTGKLLQNVTLNGQKAKKKPAKELKGKLSIVSNPVTKGATLKCVENNSLDASPVKQSYFELAAAAATAGSTISNVPSEVDNVQNFMEGVTNIFDDDDDRSPNIRNEVCGEKRLCDDRTNSRSVKSTTIKMSAKISQAELQSSINVICNVVDADQDTSSDNAQKVIASDSSGSNNSDSAPNCDALVSSDSGTVVKKTHASEQSNDKKIETDDAVVSERHTNSNHDIAPNQRRDSRRVNLACDSAGIAQLDQADSKKSMNRIAAVNANVSTSERASSVNSMSKDNVTTYKSESESSTTEPEPTDTINKSKHVSKTSNKSGKIKKSKSDVENGTSIPEDIAVLKNNVDNCNEPQDNKTICEPDNLRRSNRKRKPTERVLNDRNNQLTMQIDKSLTLDPKTIKLERLNDVNNSGEESGMDDVTPSTETYKCRFCPKRYKSKSGCYYHENSHKSKDTSLCQFCGAAYPNKHCLRQHVRLKHSKNRNRKTEFPCPFDSCSRIFTSESGLRYHKIQHQSSRVGLVCETCGKELKNETTYKKHMLDVHGPKQESPTLYPCNECNKVFRQPGSRTYHMEAVHSGRDYTCDKCGDKLKTSLTLKYHMRRHQPDYKSKCTVCGKVYQSPGGLKTHMNVHLGVLPYSCSHCDKSFPSSVRRMNHVNRYHLAKRFLCEICDKSFSDRKSFKYHVLTHTGEKPHQCPDCGKSFRSRDLVYIHQKTHRGVKDFVCSHCGQEFSQKGNLMRHFKIMHNH